MTYDTLIFDIDGTLWDSRAVVAEGYNLQLRKEGYGHLCTNAEELKPLFGKVLEEIADVLFASIPAPERYALQKRCMDTETEYMYAHPCQIGYPKVKQTLEALSKRYRLFIVSNSEQGYPELCMDKLGLAPYIQGHLCYGDTGTTKGKTIRTLMARYNIQNCVYIGDTQGDYEATLEADIPFIWAAYGFGTPAGFDAKIDSLEELLTM